MASGNQQDLYKMFFGSTEVELFGQKVEEKSSNSGQVELLDEEKIILSPDDETAKFLREKAMSIILISEKISSYMNFESLINGRLVSKWWMEWTTSEILKRKSYRIIMTTTDLCQKIHCCEKCYGDLMVVPLLFSKCLDLDILFAEDWKSDLEFILSSNGVKVVQELFPQVKNLSLKNAKKLDQLLPRILPIWNSLESLTLNICLAKLIKSRGRSRSRDYFDQILSGVPHWRLGLFIDLVRSKMEGKELGADLQKFPSLQRLIGLKHLQIDLGTADFDDFNIVRMTEVECPINVMTCRQLKILNPDLKISILSNSGLQRLLSPLAPYVNFVDNNA